MPSSRKDRSSERTERRKPSSAELNILNFLNHPRHREVRFSPVEQSFRFGNEKPKDPKKKLKGQRVPGLTKKLRRSFWPNYVYRKPRQGSGTGVSSADEGLRRGKLIHKQLRDFINLDKKGFVRRWPEVHPFVRNAIVALRAYGLKPITAELPICSDPDIPGCGVATAIDAICMDIRNQNLVLIEWKTGFDHYLMQGSGNMEGPLGGIYSDCPLHQAWFQLALTKHIVETFYGDVRVGAAYVMQLSQAGVTPLALPEDISVSALTLFDYMCPRY